MAVTVTDTRTVIDQADVLGASPITPFWNTGTAGNTVYVEAGTNSAIISTLNITTGQIYVTISPAVDVSNSLIYVWADNFALKDVWDAANPPTALHIGDGTDRVSFKMSGSNRKVFAHLDAGTGARVDWECLVLDGSQASAMNTAGYTVARAGAFSTLNLAAITQFGVDFTTLSKGLGGGVNVAVDIIRVGNDGLIITGGATGGTEGKFSEIVIEDRTTTDLKAYGIIREYTTGLYGLQGPLTFGGAATGTTWFEDGDVVLVFENRNISDDKYYLKVMGPSVSGSTTFILTNSTITTAGPNVTCNFSDAGIGTLTITGCNFAQLGNSISFANDASASGHTVTGNTFTACGQIDPGDVDFSGNTIQASTASATGAVLLDADGTANWSDLSFVSGGTGHAIYITAATTYSFTNITFSGYSTSSPGSNLTQNSGSTDAMVYNFSGGSVTLNITGGTNPTVRNGPNATTTVVATNSLDIHVQDAATGPIQNAQVAVYDSSDNSQLVNELTDVNGDINTASVEGGTNLYVRVRKSTSGTRYFPVETVATISGDLALTITLREDSIAEL